MIRTITPILSIIIAIVVYFTLIQPKVDEIRIVEAETKEYKAAVEKANELNAKIERLLAQKNSTSPENMERLRMLVPFELDDVRMLVDLKQLATQRKMLFGNVKVKKVDAPSLSTVSAEPTQMVSSESFSTADISFSLIGTYEQFKDFMSDIEKSRVLAEVTELKHTATEGDLQQFDLTVRLYALSPEL